MVHSGPDGVTGVGAAGGKVYNFGAAAFAAPPPGAVIGKVVVARTIVIPVGFAGARGHVATPPATDWVLDVTRNGRALAPSPWPPTARWPLVTTAGGAVPLAAGDVIRFVANPREDPAETALAGFAVTIVADIVP